MRSITCPRCQRRSYHRRDVQEGYCGHCHDWTEGAGVDEPEEFDQTLQDLIDLCDHAAEMGSEQTIASARLKGRTCAHCLHDMRGFASVGDDYLCHPDVGLDCYRLVTVHGHELPCQRRICEVLAGSDVINPEADIPRDALRRLGWNDWRWA